MFCNIMHSVTVWNTFCHRMRYVTEHNLFCDGMYSVTECNSYCHRMHTISINVFYVIQSFYVIEYILFLCFYTQKSILYIEWTYIIFLQMAPHSLKALAFFSIVIFFRLSAPLRPLCLIFISRQLWLQV